VRRGLPLLAVVALVAGCGGAKHAAQTAPSPGGDQLAFAGGGLTVPRRSPPISLHDVTGRPVTLAAQRGRYVLVTFLYTHCPDVCPLIAAQLNKAIAAPVGKRARLSVLAVSVDPKRDTPAAVRRYAIEHRLAPSFHYLIGSRAQLARVWHAYHVAAQPGPSGTIAHSSFEMLVDPKGTMRLIYDVSVKSKDVTGDLAKLGA
jgi:protein SCO1